MITQGPFNLTLNQPLTIQDPGSTSNNPATAIQIQNASEFIIDVNVAGTVLTIQSFTAQTIPLVSRGQPGTITPIVANQAGVTSSPSSLTLVWLMPGESSPMLDGPLTAAAVLAGLEGAGIAGVSVLAIVLNLTSGTNGLFNLANGNYQLWNVGYQPAAAAGAMVAGTVLFAVQTPILQAVDILAAPQQAGSNRLAGIHFTAASPNAGLLCNNQSNGTINAWLTYSAA